RRSQLPNRQILGCTHYPLLKKVISKVIGRQVKFVDSATETALEAKRILGKNGLLRNQGHLKGECKFFVSDEPAVFKKVGKRFLGKTIKTVKKV
ncbi:glutamate racemase, partial [Candidatus Omnitrophota bacterium]